MYSNNGCDIERDTEAGRHTLTCLMGEKLTDIIYKVMLVVWLLTPEIIFCAQVQWRAAVVYALEIPVFISIFVKQLKLHLGPKKRGMIMIGINTLNIMIGFAYIVALLMG